MDSTKPYMILYEMEETSTREVSASAFSVAQTNLFSSRHHKKLKIMFCEVFFVLWQIFDPSITTKLIDQTN